MRVLETLRTPKGGTHHLFTERLPEGWILVGPVLWCFDYGWCQDQWEWTVGYRVGTEYSLPL